MRQRRQAGVVARSQEEAGRQPDRLGRVVALDPLAIDLLPVDPKYDDQVWCDFEERAVWGQGGIVSLRDKTEPTEATEPEESAGAERVPVGESGDPK